MEYMLVTLPDEKTSLAIPTHRITGINEIQKLHSIPFATGPVKKIVIFRDKLYAIPIEFEQHISRLFLLLDNFLAIPIEGIMARVEDDFLRTEKGYLLHHGRKYKILIPERIFPQEEVSAQ